MQTSLVLEYRRLREREDRAAALERAEATSTALLRAVSHDLRTPLATMRAAVDGLVSGDARRRRPGRAGRAPWSPRPSSSSGSSTTCSTCPGSSPGCCTRCCATAAWRRSLPLAVAGEPSGSVVLEVDESTPLVRTDAGLLERVVANLVSNAVRVSAGEPVRVLAHVLARRPSRSSSSTAGPAYPRTCGSGCSSRSSGSATPVPGGLGLGLAVGARPHRGARWDADRRGHPRRRADHGAVGAARAAREAAVVSNRVLVVDDEPALARALAINLRAHGWEVVTAADGRSALDAAATDPPRRRAARPGPPRPRRHRGDRRPARLDQRCRSWCCPRASTARTRSRRSTSAPTTTSPSRSR